MPGIIVGESSVLSAQGTAITFNRSPLGYVTDIDGQFNSPPREIHPLNSSAVDEAGRYMNTYEQTTCDHTISVSVIATSFDTSSVGTKAQLLVVGTNWSINFPHAIMESMKVVAKVGDVLRVSYTFRRSFS